MPEPGRRAVVVALAGALGGLSAALAGCSRIPTGGPVQEGGAVPAEDEAGYRVEPVGPLDGATPEEVVRGFLLAGVGVDDDFRAARDFLASALRARWRPTARTLVHPQSSLEVTAGTRLPPGTEGAGSVSVQVGTVVTAEVDPRGRYRAAVPGERLDVPLTLVQEGGQWRITDAPDLLLLDDARFQGSFRLRPVVFAARTSGLLVPDTRWLLDRPSTATTLVEQVLAGPPGWLAPAVTSGAPPGTQLPTGSVAVAAGVASVDLPASLQRQTTAALRQLQQQLVATLRGLGSSVSTVEVSLDGGALAPTAVPSLDPGPGDGVPVVLSGGRLCRLAGGELVPVDDLPDLTGASSPAVLREQVAVLVAGRTAVQRLLVGVAAPAPVPLGAELTPPSLDASGWVWTTPAACTGVVSAVGEDGAVVAVEAPWLAGRRVVGVRVAHDGARALVASTGEAGRPDAVRVDMAGVSRSGDGTPQALSTDLTAPPTPWLAQVLAAVWVGPTSAAVLGTALPGSGPAVAASEATRQALAGGAPTVWLLDGGLATDLGGPPPDAVPVTLAGGSGRQSLVVGGADGRVWPREGSRWLPLGVSATDPAYPG